MKTSTKSVAKAECQICEGHFCTKNGLIVKHGYKRPGDGFLHGECMGVGHKPFPATDALEAYSAAISKALSDSFAYANRLLSHEVTTLTKISIIDRTVTQLAIGVTDKYVWEHEYRDAIYYANKRVRSLVDEMVRVTARIERAKALQAA